MKEILTAIGVTIVLVLIAAGIVFGSFYATEYFAPKYEQVRHDTMKNSQAYNDGMIRDLQDMRVRYMSADADGKRAIRAIALHRFATFPEDKMPAELREFYRELKNEGAIR